MDPHTTPESTPDPQSDAAGPVPTVHIYVLLDRSGSMSSVADDVVGGFNGFVQSQRSDEDAVLTLVQFDAQDPQEVLIDAVPIASVPPLTADRFVPRGSTPLLDATGLLLARAQERTIERALAGTPETPVLVTITDGHENSSREFTRSQIKGLIAEREAAGWAFVFLTAALDAYDEALSVGFHPGAVQSWSPDAGGADLAFRSLGEAMHGHRGKNRSRRAAPSQEFFETGKPAEADRRRKRGDDR